MSDGEGPAPAPAARTLPSLLPPLGASDDDGSVYGGLAAGSDTTSLMSSITRYREENGRTCHSHGSTEHWGSNDSKAQDPQDLTHRLWTLALKGKFYLAPIKKPTADPWSRNGDWHLGGWGRRWAFRSGRRRDRPVANSAHLDPAQCSLRNLDMSNFHFRLWT
jgi:hypothetical protein